jgi:CMP/dCMP kinase
LIITIDGPGGAGKSTIARKLAEAVGYEYLDTGAIYRATAYAYVAESPVDLDAFLGGLSFFFSFTGKTTVRYGDEDITEKIRMPEISMLASSLSQKPSVREYSTGIQKRLGEGGGIVVEGRDAGSVVFPHAELKFYLDAHIEERARRRYLEISATQGGADIEQVKAEIERRDRDDSERDIAPLIRPEGSIYVDTTDKTIEEVVHLLRGYVRQAEGV